LFSIGPTASLAIQGKAANDAIVVVAFGYSAPLSLQGYCKNPNMPNEQMKLTLLLLSLLIPAVLQAQTPQIGAAAVAAKKYTVIPVLPYSITKPGTYVLLSSLTVPSGTTGITINAPGKVVLNLNGFGIEAGDITNGTGIVVQSSNVTIENGSLLMFNGIIVGNPNTLALTPIITGFVIHNVELAILAQGLFLNNINGGNVYDCQFGNVGFLGNDGNAISENACENIQYSNISIYGAFLGIISITGGSRLFSQGIYINKLSGAGSVSTEQAPMQ
jgi:hypothetical protein